MTTKTRIFSTKYFGARAQVTNIPKVTGMGQAPVMVLATTVVAAGATLPTAWSRQTTSYRA